MFKIKKTKKIKLEQHLLLIYKSQPIFLAKNAILLKGVLSNPVRLLCLAPHASLAFGYL